MGANVCGGLTIYGIVDFENNHTGSQRTMATRSIKASDLLADLKAGTDDASLMEKYHLSARALLKAMTNLLWKGLIPPLLFSSRKTLIKTALTEKQEKINTDSIIRDIQSGMNDSELREKYDLSHKGLLRLMERLVDSKLIPPSNLMAVSETYRRRVHQGEQRSHPRAYITAPIPIYDMTSGTTGLLRDISRQGFRIAGIDSSVGDLKPFQLPLATFMKSDPVVIIGECRWVTRKAAHNEYSVTGYRMSTFTEGDANAVRKFISFLLFSESGHWKIVK
jgi:uncharacterized protein (DUF433 family)